MWLLREGSDISTVQERLYLGSKEVDEGFWLISSMSCDRGYRDLKQNKLKTIDNPLGTSL